MNKRMQQIASLMRRTQRKTGRLTGETEDAYFRRLHDTAIEIQRKERARRRKAVRAA